MLNDFAKKDPGRNTQLCRMRNITRCSRLKLLSMILMLSIVEEFTEMYNITSLDEILMVGVVVSFVVYLAIKGELFKGW